MARSKKAIINENSDLKLIVDSVLDIRLQGRDDKKFILEVFHEAAKNTEKPIEEGMVGDFDKTLESLDDASMLLDYIIGTYDFRKERNQSIDKETLATEATERFKLLKDAEKKSEGVPYYDPRISTLKAFEEYFYAVNKPMAYQQPGMTPVNDIFKTVFQKLKAFCEMISMGLYDDAFVSWRTIHESECMLKLLITGGEKVRTTYVKHLAYSNYMRSQRAVFTKEELDSGFAQIKSEMAKYNLKSKDMLHFIEYGWVYEHPNFNPEDKDFRLTFRKGIERVAGLENYSDIYEASSEITHASTIFFYVNDELCKRLALTLVYEASARIGELFMDWVKPYFVVHGNHRRLAQKLLNEVKEMSVYFDKEYDIENLMKDVTGNDEA